jgi:hypothetical protein
MSRVEFSAMLRSIGFKYSYLGEEELQKEVAAGKDLLKSFREYLGLRIL